MFDVTQFKEKRENREKSVEEKHDISSSLHIRHVKAPISEPVIFRQPDKCWLVFMYEWW